MQITCGRNSIRNGTSRDFYLKAAKAGKAKTDGAHGARGAWVLLDAAKPVQVARWHGECDAVGCGLDRSGVMGDWWLRPEGDTDTLPTCAYIGHIGPMKLKG